MRPSPVETYVGVLVDLHGRSLSNGPISRIVGVKLLSGYRMEGTLASHDKQEPRGRMSNGCGILGPRMLALS